MKNQKPARCVSDTSRAAPLQLSSASGSFLLQKGTHAVQSHAFAGYMPVQTLLRRRELMKVLHTIKPKLASAKPKIRGPEQASKSTGICNCSILTLHVCHVDLPLPVEDLGGLGCERRQNAATGPVESSLRPLCIRDGGISYRGSAGGLSG